MNVVTTDYTEENFTNLIMNLFISNFGLLPKLRPLAQVWSWRQNLFLVLSVLYYKILRGFCGKTQCWFAEDHPQTRIPFWFGIKTQNVMVFYKSRFKIHRKISVFRQFSALNLSWGKRGARNLKIVVELRASESQSWNFLTLLKYK